MSYKIYLTRSINYLIYNIFSFLYLLYFLYYCLWHNRKIKNLFFLSVIHSACRHYIARVRYTYKERRKLLYLGSAFAIAYVRAELLSAKWESMSETYGWNYENWPACHASACYDGVQPRRWRARRGPKPPRGKKQRIWGPHQVSFAISAPLCRSKTRNRVSRTST